MMDNKRTVTTGLSQELLSLDAKNKELNAELLKVKADNMALRNGGNTMNEVKERDKIDLVQTRNQAQLSHIEDTLKRLRAAKPPERSEEARCYAIVITEIEKARAYFKTYILDVESGDQF